MPHSFSMNSWICLRIFLTFCQDQIGQSPLNHHLGYGFFHFLQASNKQNPWISKQFLASWFKQPAFFYVKPLVVFGMLTSSQHATCCSFLKGHGVEPWNVQCCFLLEKGKYFYIWYTYKHIRSFLKTIIFCDSHGSFAGDLCSMHTSETLPNKRSNFFGHKRTWITMFLAGSTWYTFPRGLLVGTISIGIVVDHSFLQLMAEILHQWTGLSTYWRRVLYIHPRWLALWFLNHQQ